MFEPRIRLADAHHAGVTAGHDGSRDDPALVQRGWDMWADFGSGQLYDQARGQALTTSGAFVWAATPRGGSIDWNASATNANLTFPAYPPPARFTVAALLVVGTLQNENICTWHELADSNTFDRQLRFTATNNLNWYSYGGANFDSAASFTTGQIVHAVTVFDGSAQHLYIDGRLDTTAATGSSGYGGFSANSGIKIGHKAGSGGYASSTHKILAFGVAPVAYDAGQVFELWQRPFGQVAPRRRTRGMPASGGAYTLTAAHGAYTLAGQTVNLRAARQLAAGTGTYALTGQNVLLRVSRQVAAGTGSFALSGQSVGLYRGRVPLVASVGNFALSAQDANLLAARLVTMEPGIYTLAGRDVGLSYSAAPIVAVGGLGKRTRRGARRIYMPEPQASAVFHPNALPDDLAATATPIWQDDDDEDVWILLA